METSVPSVPLPSEEEQKRHVDKEGQKMTRRELLKDIGAGFITPVVMAEPISNFIMDIVSDLDEQTPTTSRKQSRLYKKDEIAKLLKRLDEEKTKKEKWLINEPFFLFNECFLFTAR